MFVESNKHFSRLTRLPVTSYLEINLGSIHVRTKLFQENLLRNQA